MVERALPLLFACTAPRHAPPAPSGVGVVDVSDGPILSSAMALTDARPGPHGSRVSGTWNRPPSGEPLRLIAGRADVVTQGAHLEVQAPPHPERWAAFGRVVFQAVVEGVDRHPGLAWVARDPAASPPPGITCEPSDAIEDGNLRMGLCPDSLGPFGALSAAQVATAGADVAVNLRVALARCAATDPAPLRSSRRGGPRPVPPVASLTFLLSDWPTRGAGEADVAGIELRRHLLPTGSDPAATPCVAADWTGLSPRAFDAILDAVEPDVLRVVSDLVAALPD
jgi:hypothetical protein